MKFERVRWGIIGCGDVTERKSGPGFRKAERSSLQAVMRRSGDLAQDYARRHGVPTWYDDADALIGDPEVDAVYVATPPSSHREYVLRVARAGKPVYVEKPMGRTYAECREMVDACGKAGVPLFVAYYRRGLAKFLKAKELIDAGAIGAPRAASLRFFQKPQPQDLSGDASWWRTDPSVSGAGYFYDMGSHQVDLLHYFLGPVAEARGVAINQEGLYRVEDTVAAALRFESGVSGSCVWSFTAGIEEDILEIVGNRGVVRMPVFAPGPLRLLNGDGEQEFDLPNPEHVQQPLIQMTVDDLTGRGVCPSSGRSAAEANRVLEEILAGTGFSPTEQN